jgi:hypothetical protein
MGDPSAQGQGVVLATHHRKTQHVTEHYTVPHLEGYLETTYATKSS